MAPSTKYVLVGLLILSVGMQAVARQTSPAFRTRGGVIDSRTIESRLPSFAISEEMRVKSTLEEKVNELVAERNFNGLENLATVLRRSHIETASGVWYLSTFYHVLTYEWPESSEISERTWMERQIFLNKWAQESPVSITAQVALARYWKNYAWKARGRGKSQTVTQAAWELFEARLIKSADVLDKARKLRSKCPMWWDTMQVVALGRSAGLEDFNEIFDEAVRFEPGYTQFYINKAIYLTPHFFGKDGDWQKFAAKAADEVGGDAGHMLYARIGWRVHQKGFYAGFLRDSGYSWSRMKKGLQLIVANHSESITPASELAYLAYQAGDRDCAKPMFAKIGLAVDRNTWDDGMARFIRARTWALMN
jgi:hypothetical protein